MTMMMRGMMVMMMTGKIGSIRLCAAERENCDRENLNAGAGGVREDV